MKQKAAKRDLSIKIVTSVVFIMMLGFFVASIYINGLIIAALIMLIIVIFCYLYAPTAFEISALMCGYFFGLTRITPY